MDKDNNNIVGLGNQNTAIKKLDASVIFANDPYGLFVFQKTEKLVAGTYILTKYLSDREPLKWSVRESANALLLKALSLSDRVWGEDDIVSDLTLSLAEISSMFNMAKISDLISQTNYEIITTEFSKLADFLSTSSNNISSAKIAFGNSLFAEDYSFTPSQSYKDGSPVFQKGSTSVDFNKGQKDIKDNRNYSVFNKMSDGKNSPKEKIVKDKSNRQEVITSMLKSGAKLTIKDFTKNIKDCSEKTIQRELISLVAKGVLKKEGERRWSKYFIS